MALAVFVFAGKIGVAIDLVHLHVSFAHAAHALRWRPRVGAASANTRGRAIYLLWRGLDIFNVSSLNFASSISRVLLYLRASSDIGPVLVHICFKPYSGRISRGGSCFRFRAMSNRSNRELDHQGVGRPCPASPWLHGPEFRQTGSSRRARALWLPAARGLRHELLETGFRRHFWKSLFGTSLDRLASQVSLSDNPTHLRDRVCGVARAKSKHSVKSKVARTREPRVAARPGESR